jgi:hypothetical protein
MDADAADFVATWVARDRVARRASRLALTIAGVSTAAAAVRRPQS